MLNCSENIKTNVTAWAKSVDAATAEIIAKDHEVEGLERQLVVAKQLVGRYKADSGRVNSTGIPADAKVNSKRVADLESELKSLKQDKGDKKLRNVIQKLTTERDSAVATITTSQEILRAEQAKLIARDATITELRAEIVASAKAHEQEKNTMKAAHQNELDAAKKELEKQRVEMVEEMKKDYENAVKLQLAANREGWGAFNKKHFKGKEGGSSV